MAGSLSENFQRIVFDDQNQIWHQLVSPRVMSTVWSEPAKPGLDDVPVCRNPENIARPARSGRIGGFATVSERLWVSAAAQVPLWIVLGLPFGAHQPVQYTDLVGTLAGPEQVVKAS